MRTAVCCTFAGTVDDVTVEAMVVRVVFGSVEVLVEHPASPIAIALATAATMVRVAGVLGTLGWRSAMACVCNAVLLSPP